MKILVSSPSGLEGVTKRELYNLLKIETTALNGRLFFDGTIKEVALCNLHLRTASRVFIEIGSFKASNFDALFDGVLNLDFEKYISKNGKIEVYGSSIESKLSATTACASVIKKAICTRLERSYNCKLDESKERYKIEFIIRRDFVTIALDTSGEGLHKRGYRKLVGEAPLKENVASSLINLSFWKPNMPLVDVFCGSGTILIEACMLARNIPAGLNRHFDFLDYSNFDTSFYEEMLNDAKSKITDGKDLHLIGFDIDESQLKLARLHAKNAGVLENIHFQKGDMRDFTSRFSSGVIITNPPYGERLLDRKQIVLLYKDFGKMANRLDGWSYHVITPVSDFERLFNKKADKKRKIYSGKLPCTFYSFFAKKTAKRV